MESIKASKKGRRKESKYLFNEARRRGSKDKKQANDSKTVVLIKSAASQSPVDMLIIDPVLKQIKLLQSKLNLDEKRKEKIEKECSYLNGVYSVEFKAV